MSAQDQIHHPAAQQSPSSSESSRPRLTSTTNRSCNHRECHNVLVSHHVTHSPYSSPHSASLPSPPDSPPLDPYADTDLDSISSFPSVSSSVFFSSSAGSPHSQPRYQEHEHDGLIIPSLTLPSKLPQPTPYGQTLGDLSLLFVGPSGGGKTALAEFLADADDIVDAADWEDIDGGRILRASTDWMEENDAHGLDRFEGAENVSFTELNGFDHAENPKRVAERILKHVHGVFNDVRNHIDSTPSSSLLHSLLASSHSPLYAALIYVTATPLTEQDREIISSISSSIPIVLCCTAFLSSNLTSFSHGASTPLNLSSFQPHSQLSLRTGLFRSPQTISALRVESADRFMRWREAERCLENTTAPIRTAQDCKQHSFKGPRRSTITTYCANSEEIENWNKATWEAMLSEDVSRRLRQARSLEKSESNADSSCLEDSVLFNRVPCFSPVLDPLHFRSLMALSMSLLSPSLRSDSRSKLKEMTMTETHSTVRPTASRSRSKTNKHKKDAGGDKWSIWRWGLAFLCAGVSIGCMLSTFS